MWKKIENISDITVGSLCKTKDGEIVLIGNCSDQIENDYGNFYTYFAGCGCCACDYYLVEYDNSLVEIINKKLESLS